MSRPSTISSSEQNKRKRKQILPRTDRYREMINEGLVPKSNECLVIIPCVQKTFGFKTNQYNCNKQFLEGHITKQQFKKFVHESNKIIEQEMINKTKKQNESFFWIISTLLKISTVIAILTFFLFSTIVFLDLDDATTEKILIIAGGLLSSASMIAAVCPIILYTSKFEPVNEHEIIKKRLNELTGLTNKQFIESGKGYLKWKIQAEYFWIELQINSNSYKMNHEFQTEDNQIKNYENELSAQQFVHNNPPKDVFQIQQQNNNL